MAVIKNLIVRAGADFSELEKKSKALEKKMKTWGNNMQNVGKTLTASVTIPVMGAAAASFKFAAEMEDAMGASDQIFKESSATMKEWAKNLDSYYGIASGEALEYANMMGSMLQNIGGMTEEEAAKQSQTLIKLAGDLTAMYGGTTEDAVRALTGALKGNNTMLDNYGMAVNDAMVKTKAYEMGLYSGKGEMALATKQAATLALIMEQSGAAQGQAAREAEGASGSLRTLKTEMKNLATNIGEVLLPIVTPLIEKLNDMVKAFSKLDDDTKEAIVKFALFAAAVGPVLIVTGKLVTSLSSIAKFLRLSAKAAPGCKVIGDTFLGINPVIATTATILGGILATILELARQKDIWDNILGGGAITDKNLNPAGMATRYGTDYAFNSGSTQGVAYAGAYQNLTGNKPSTSATILGRGGTRPEDLKTTIDVGGTITIKGDTSKKEFDVAAQRAQESILNQLRKENRR